MPDVRDIGRVCVNGTQVSMARGYTNFAGPLVPYHDAEGHPRSTSADNVGQILADHRAEHLEGPADSRTYIVSRPV